MTALIIFLLLLFTPVLAHAGDIQPPTAEQWKAAKTCSQAVAVASRQATFDMKEIGVPLTQNQLRPVIFQELKTIPNSPCFQSANTSKSEQRSQN